MLWTLLLPCAASAQESAAFLKIGVGARAAAMGGAYTAAADDVDAIAWNPAGLAGVQKRELGATHMELLAGTRYEFLGYAHPTSLGAFAAALSYLSHASIPGRDVNGAPTGRFDAWDGSVGAAYAVGLAGLPGASFGAGVKYVRSELAEARAQSVAVDLGVRYEAPELVGPGSLIAAAAVQNLGRGMRFLSERSRLPLTAAFGLGYRLPAGLLITIDYKHRPEALSSELSAGTEFSFIPQLALRAGYDSHIARRGGVGDSSPVRGFAAGFGIRVLDYSLDYALTPFGELGRVQRFSLGARF